jgi:hypothetical protein
MRVTERDGGYAASHISGPTHNMLFLRLGNGPAKPFEVTVLPAIGECSHHEGLTAEEMIPAICAGVGRANGELGTDFRVEHAEIVENDSRRPDVYEMLARQIARQAAGN